MKNRPICSLSIFSIAVVSALLAGNNVTAQVNNTGFMFNTGQLRPVNTLTNKATGTIVNKGTIETADNITNNGSSFDTAGAINLTGASTQTIDGSVPLRTTNVLFNNSTGFALNNVLRVSGVATLTSGLITTGSVATTNALEFTSTGTHTGTSNASHVVGWVRKEGTGNFSYPVGDNTSYEKTDVNLSANASGIQVRYTGSDAGSAPYGTGGTTAAPLVGRNLHEYWEIQPVSTAAGTVTVYWNNYKNVGISNTSGLRVAHLSGGSWLNEGGNGITGTVANGSVTSNALSSWSPFTLGTVDPIAPLPLELSSFTAAGTNCKALINWTTNNEQNIVSFELERAGENGINYTTIAKVAAKGNANGETLYSVTDDKATNGSNTYRLKWVETGGAYRYTASLKVIVQCSGKDGLTIYPNPTTDLVYVKGLSGVERIKVFNATGQLVIDQIAKASETISLRNFAAGIYHLMISGAAGNTFSASIIKQ